MVAPAYEEPVNFTKQSGHVYKCPQCQAQLWSKHVHDWVCCSCPNHCFVDGGSDYLHCGAKRDFPVLMIINPLIKSPRP